MYMGQGLRTRQPARPGFFGSRSATSTRDASRYPGTSCPPGNVLVRRETQPRSPRFIGDKTSDDFVYCRPAPAAAPVRAPAPVSGPTYTTTISPVMQQAFTPQISPTIQVTTDSPGAQVGATTQQTAPGGQQAEGGGSGADVDAIARLLESQRAFQDELDRRAQEQREHELVRAAEREAADRRERERDERERIAVMEAEERQRLEEPPMITPAVMPGSGQFIPLEAPMRPGPELVIDRGQPVEPVEPEAEAPNTMLIIAIAGAVLLIGGYAYSRQRRKRT